MKLMFTLWRGVFTTLLFSTFAVVSQGQSDCGTAFFDTGGNDGNYDNNELETWTFCPDDPGDIVTVTFSSFNTEANWDRLYVYDGPDDQSPQIASSNGIGSGFTCQALGAGGFWGNLNAASATLPGPFSATSEGGCLTFVFCSDGSVTRPGWEALVTCGPPPNCESPVISYTQERNCDDLTFSVEATVDAASVPSTAPILVASASVDGVDLPGVGGTFPNIAGSTLDIGPLPLDETVVITISVFGFDCPTSEIVSEVSNGCPIPLVCGEALEETYCYADNEDTPFLYVSPDGEPVQFFFNEGLIAFGDFVTIYDGVDDTGIELFEGTNTSLTGTGVVAESGSLFMNVVSNGFTSCQTNGFNTSIWTYTVGCGLDFEGCTDEEANNFSPIATIDNGSCIIGGEDCETPGLVESLPYTTTANTEDFGNNYSSADVPPTAPNVVGSSGAPSTFYLNGSEAVFSYTPTEDGFIDIFISGHLNSTGVWAFTGCPFESTVGFNNVSSSATKGIFGMPVVADTEYFVVIATTSTVTFTNFNLTIQNTVWECPDFDANIGGFCTQDGGAPGQLSENCECLDIDFDGCDTPTGFQNGILSADCEEPVTVTNGTFNNYHTMNVNNGAEYTFTSNPFATFDIIYITILNEDGTEILASGGNIVNWTSDFNGAVRFRTDGNSDCTSPGFFSHSRTVSVNCENIIYDCPDFDANIGEVCLDGGEFGILNEDCGCDLIEFDGCTTGGAFGSLNPTCDAPDADQTGSWNNEYTPLNVLNGGTYTFTTSENPAVPLFFITITNGTGTNVLATGINSVVYVAEFNGPVRFYTHSQADCGGLTGSITSHTKSVSLDCSTLIFDCPDLEVNFGTPCDLTDGSIGLISEECECAEVEFDGCTTGFQSFAAANPNCDGTPTNLTFVGPNSYNNVSVFNGVEYTFSHTEPVSSPVLYITITNADASVILATGIASVTYTADYNGIARFYTHAADDCITPTGNWTHTRIITADCTNQIFDCPDLAANIGTACEAEGGVDGIVTADCECVELIGTDCTNPFVVSQSELPFTMSANTAIFGDNYSGADVPAQAPGAIGTGGFSTFYLDGDDVVYEFTPDDDTFVDVTLPAHGSWAGLWAFTDCPFESTVGWHTGSGANDGRSILQLPVNAGVTYYFVVSTWPAPQSIDYTIVIEETVFDCPDIFANIGDPCDFSGIAGIVTEDCECQVLVGDNCENPFVVEQSALPFNFAGNTSTFGDDYDGSDVPPAAPGATGTGGFSNFYLGGDDVSFEFTPETNTFIDISVVETGNWVGLWVFTDCPFASTVAWHTGFDANGRFVDALEVEAGTTYYVVISTWPAPQSTDFDITISETVFDCPELNSNIGDFCDLNGGAGELDENCECVEIDFDGCSTPTGFQNGILVANCDAPVTATNASFQNYHTVAVQNGGEYTFTSPSFGQFQLVYITILDGTGTEILASGANILNWTADFNGNIRFRTDGNDDCSSPGFFSHSRTVEVNCETFIYDCPELTLNFGDPCDDGDDELFGSTIDENCECTGGEPFEGCTTGGSFGTRTMSCESPLQEIFGSWANEYSTINGIDDAYEYTFTLSNPDYFVTVTNSTGTEVLASGQGLVVWNATIDGTVRFYSHVDGACSTTGGSATTHTRTVLANCDVVSIPECDAATFIAATPAFAGSQISVSITGEEGSGVDECVNPENPQVDKWFSFTSVTSNMYIRAWGLGDFDMAVEVYDACGGELLICQNDAPAGLREIVIVTGTTIGETYYFRTYHAGDDAPATETYTVAVAHIPFTQLRAQDCGVLDYVPGDLIRSDWPVNQFLLTNFEFEFTELEEPFNTYEIISPNGSNPNFNLAWFTQAEFGRTYSVRTRVRMYQGPNWGEYGAACTIGFADVGATTQLIASQALGFYNMCDVLEANNVSGASSYLWTFSNGFEGEEVTHTTTNRFCQLKNVMGLSLGTPYAVTVQSTVLGVLSEPGLTRLIAMNNFVPTTGLDPDINTCGSTYELNAVLSAINICAAEFYTFQFTNISNPDQSPLFYTRDDGLRTIVLSWVTGLVPGDTYEVTVLGASGGLVGTYGPACEITIAGGDDDESGFTGGGAAEVADADMTQIDIYPNPSNGDEVMLVLSNLVDEQQAIIIQVFDMYGKAVHTQNVGNNGNQMNTALRFQRSLAAGVYTVNIIVNENLIGAQKIVVQ